MGLHSLCFQNLKSKSNKTVKTNTVGTAGVRSWRCWCRCRSRHLQSPKSRITLIMGLHSLCFQNLKSKSNKTVKTNTVGTTGAGADIFNNRIPWEDREGEERKGCGGRIKN
ncbi:hypothetical protein Hanom_Chr08g00740811 [Helianthus anomalus]